MTNHEMYTILGIYGSVFLCVIVGMFTFKK